MNELNNILFPEFVTLFINETNESCVYFFRGLDNDYNYIYQGFDEEKLPVHSKQINEDGSIIYKFHSKINNLRCNLIGMNELIKNKQIFIENI